MRYLLACLVMVPALAAAQAPTTYHDVIEGTVYDPAIRAWSPNARQAFLDTLNGPQTPARKFDGLTIYETCTAHMCAFAHSVIAIDKKHHTMYAATYNDDGRTLVVPNAEIETKIGHACEENRCVFEGED